MSEGYDLALEEWLGVLAELWKAAGKPVEADRLEIYAKSLGDVPLGLLKLAMLRVIRENTYNIVPLPGVVLEAVRRELGNPWDIKMAIEAWIEAKWRRAVINLGED